MAVGIFLYVFEITGNIIELFCSVRKVVKTELALNFLFELTIYSVSSST